ncbi:MAG: NACHT domain-containing protein, partial [Chlamydiia bacterium]|nr:NACHT domain-containing protein [Chlamydiia bacterium]
PPPLSAYTITYYPSHKVFVWDHYGLRGGMEGGGDISSKKESSTGQGTTYNNNGPVTNQGNISIGTQNNHPVADTVTNQGIIQIGTQNNYLTSTPTPQLEESDLMEALRMYYSQKATLTSLIGNRKMPIEGIYVRLAMIGEEERKQQKESLESGFSGTSEKEAKKLEDDRISTYESIFQPKKAVEIEKLFDEPKLKSAPQKRVIIYGSAGVGKSTFCQKIAYSYATGSPVWPQFKTLFWIKLRYVTEKDNEKSLYELIGRECGFEWGSFQDLMKDKGFRDECLLLLDGYDELSDLPIRLKTSGGQYFKALEAFQKEFSHILITSRPQTIDEIPNLQEFEILGFDEKRVNEYIQKFFPQDKQNQKEILEKSLKNPYIRSLSRIPINLEIFASVALDGSSFFTQSDNLNMTSIYIGLTNHLFGRYLTDKKEIKKKEEVIGLDLLELDEILHLTKALEDIAFKATTQGKIFLGLSEINPIFTTNKVSFQERRSIGPFRIDEAQGSFIHLTFQEFFAAAKIARFYSEKDRALAQAEIYENKFEPRYQLVWQITAGILSQNHPEYLSTYIDDLMSEPKDLAVINECSLLAACFEQCKDPSILKQYTPFIRTIVHLIRHNRLTNNHLFQVLGASTKVFQHDEIVNVICENLLDYNNEAKQQYTLNELKVIAKTAVCVPQKIWKSMIEIIENTKASLRVKNSAVTALGSMAVVERLPSKKVVEELVKLFKNPKADSYAKNSATEALGSIARAGQLPTEKVEELTKTLQNPEADLYARNSALQILGELAKGGQALPLEVIDLLMALLKNPTAKSSVKESVIDALKSIARAGQLPVEKVEELTKTLQNPEASPYARNSALQVLGELARAGQLPAEKVEELTKTLQNHKADPYARNSALQILGELAKGGQALPLEVIDLLMALLKDPTAKSNIKESVIDALGSLAIAGQVLPQEMVDLLKNSRNVDEYVINDALWAMATTGQFVPPEKAYIAALLNPGFYAGNMLLIAKSGYVFSDEGFICLFQQMEKGGGETAFFLKILNNICKKTLLTRSNAKFAVLYCFYTGNALFIKNNKLCVADRKKVYSSEFRGTSTDTIIIKDVKCVAQSLGKELGLKP